MSAPTRLSGFKILGGVVRLTLLHAGHEDGFPSLCTRLLRGEKRNLIFLTCAGGTDAWTLDMILDPRDAPCVLDLFEARLSRTRCHTDSVGILSLFPHKHQPEVTGALLDLLHRQNLLPDAIAHSTSAISAVLPEASLDAVSRELFHTFRFSAFRTPEDWKLTQKEKETLYKEVVASYQEQRPRVYGLDWQDRQELFQLRLNRENLAFAAGLFRGLSRIKLPLVFLTTAPGMEGESEKLFFCLPQYRKPDYEKLLAAFPPEAMERRTPGVAYFSMNGPHFGDRYGIATELFASLREAGVELLALSCSIASIAGAVPAPQMRAAIDSMRDHFDIPSVNQRQSI
jgi:hypothetical protein